jgi:drug/metabolite transporter (DMT)-like permease
MIYLLLTILCSSSIALILKFNSNRKGHPVVMLTGNYFIASIIAAIIILFEGGVKFSVETLLYGSILGVMFIISFFIFAKAIELSGTALATVSSRLSVFIPVFLVVVFFGEEPQTKTYFGFLLTILTIIFFYYSLNNEEPGLNQRKKYLYLIAVLIFIGINDFAIKFFQLLRSSSEENFFVYMIFTTAFLSGFSVIIIKKIGIYKNDLYTGFVLGIPNVFSTIFLLGALNTIPAMIVYPVVNIGVILVTTIAAYTIYKETLNKYGIGAILMGTAAILLLSL